MSQYERQTSKLLTKCCKLAVEQFHTEDGWIKPPDGYTQTTSFKILETKKSLKGLGLDLDLDSELQSSIDDLQKIQEIQEDQEDKEVYIGFVLTSETDNIIALRGTQSSYEWIADFRALQSYYDMSDRKRGKIHRGFKALYNELKEQIIDAVKKLYMEPKKPKPCYVTGHSLGAALAVLAATDIALNIDGLKDQVQMYNYAGPRVGNSTFASFYDKLVPNSYRVVNIADIVPMFPSKPLYKHVGQEWSYLWPTRHIGMNHYLDYLGHNYLHAVNSEWEQQKNPHIPLYSIDCHNEIPS